jgi:ATP-binding cassette subfamily G (WHITE) protein 2 (SNQ2)
MFDVIGAGATATSSVDWPTDLEELIRGWCTPQEQIKTIHDEGQAQPVIRTQLPTEFTTSWVRQIIALTQRNFQA